MLEEGTFSTTSRFEIDEGETKSTSVILKLPEMTWNGWHTLRIVASNDYTKAITHREIRVVD